MRSSRISEGIRMTAPNAISIATRMFGGETPLKDREFGPDDVGILGKAPADHDESDLGCRGYACAGIAAGVKFLLLHLPLITSSKH
jgi:hypothetical protein